MKNEGANVLLLLAAERKGCSKVAIPGDFVLWVAKKYIDSVSGLPKLPLR